MNCRQGVSLTVQILIRRPQCICNNNAIPVSVPYGEDFLLSTVDIFISEIWTHEKPPAQRALMTK